MKKRAGDDKIGQDKQVRSTTTTTATAARANNKSEPLTSIDDGKDKYGKSRQAPSKIKAGASGVALGAGLVGRIEEGVVARLITRRKHPTEALWIYNYSKRCQYERAWSDATRVCRGLVVDDRGRVVARGFSKFFNHDEYPLPAKRWREAFQVFQKYDGSLGIAYVEPSTQRVAIATRGSFSSPQALRATQMLHAKYKALVPHLHRGLTQEGLSFLFEIVYPENKIIVDYKGQEKLVLLAVLDTATGLDAPQPPQWCTDTTSSDTTAFTDSKSEIVNTTDGAHAGGTDGIDSKSVGFEVARRLSGAPYETYEALTQHNRGNEEGFVVRFPSDGLRVKIKFDNYKKINAAMSQVSSTAIWKTLSAQPTHPTQSPKKHSKKEIGGKATAASSDGKATAASSLSGSSLVQSRANPEIEGFRRDLIGRELVLQWDASDPSDRWWVLRSELDRTNALADERNCDWTDLEPHERPSEIPFDDLAPPKPAQPPAPTPSHTLTEPPSVAKDAKCVDSKDVKDSKGGKGGKGGTAAGLGNFVSAVGQGVGSAVDWGLLPDGYARWAERVRGELEQGYRDCLATVDRGLGLAAQMRAKKNTRAQVVLALQKQFPAHTALVLAALALTDKSPADDPFQSPALNALVWKFIKPKHETPTSLT